MLYCLPLHLLCLLYISRARLLHLQPACYYGAFRACHRTTTFTTVTWTAGRYLPCAAFYYHLYNTEHLAAPTARVLLDAI